MFCLKNKNRLAKERKLYKDEIELVNDVKRGKNDAFRRIVDRYRMQIIKVSAAMVGNIYDAEDVAQDVFVRFYKNINQYKGDAALGTYLTKIAMNLSLNLLKKRKSEQWKNNELKVNYDKQKSDPYKSIDNKTLVEQALQLLPPDFKTVVVLRLVQGYSTKETAELLNLPLGTVLSRLARGQQKLKEILNNLQNE